MKRGSIVIVQQAGTFANKARPCIVVQNALALGHTRWVTVCPITSHLTGAALIRVPLAEGSVTGLKKPSEVEVDLIFTAECASVMEVVGEAPRAAMFQVDAALRRWLDL